MRTIKKQVFMNIAHQLGLLSTCQRRQVGCLAIDEHDHIIATGYNGVPAGVPHCIDKLCAGADYPTGEALEICSATHAEQNMLMQCSDVMKIKAIFTTTYPCDHCIKMISNTSCQKIYYAHAYASKQPWSGEVEQV
jgi:dCMP deaminase